MNEAMVQSQAIQPTSFKESVELQAVRWFYAAKGFGRIFWGLLMAMILFFGNADVEVFHVVRIPAYVVGSALTGWGLWILSDSGAVSKKWLKRIRVAMALVGLEIYFAPFVEWWKATPHVPFFLMNVLGLLLTSMLALFFIDLLAADIFCRLQDRQGQIEAWVFAGAVALLMIVPLLLMALFCTVAAIRHQTAFEFEIWQAIIRMPLWSYMVFTVPCSLTLIAAWKAKDLCYRHLGRGEMKEKA